MHRSLEKIEAMSTDSINFGSIDASLLNYVRKYREVPQIWNPAMLTFLAIPCNIFYSLQSNCSLKQKRIQWRRLKQFKISATNNRNRQRIIKPCLLYLPNFHRAPKIDITGKDQGFHSSDYAQSTWHHRRLKYSLRLLRIVNLLSNRLLRMVFSKIESAAGCIVAPPYNLPFCI